MKFTKFYFLPLLIMIFLAACDGQQTTGEGQGITDADPDQLEAPEMGEEAFVGQEDYADQNLMDFANEYGLNSFAAALSAANLTDSIQQLENYTVFAPTDEAFDKLPEDLFNQLMLPENQERLRDILSYHMLPGQVVSGDLNDGMAVNTLAGSEIMVSIGTDGIEINGQSRVLDADIRTEDGLVHVINEVLIPADDG